MKRRTILPVGLLALLAACAGDGLDAGSDSANLTNCEGSCAAYSALDWRFYRDSEELDLGDLTSRKATLANSATNTVLGAIPFTDISLEPTKLFATAERAAGDNTLLDLDALSEGLGARFGETELSAEVARVRADYARANDAIFAEKSFKLGLDIDPNFTVESFGVGGDNEGKIRLGFELGKTKTARLVSAYSSERDAVMGAPLAVLQEAREFIFPRNIDDVRALRPGESIGIMGEGKFGINVGAGIPILLAQPTSAITYNLVITAGFRARLEGTMDVQLVKTDNNVVVVDVGMSKERSTSVSVAMKDAFGVQGLVSSHVELGSISLDLGKLLDKAINTTIGDKLHALEASAGYSNEKSRLSMARFRFNLDDVQQGSDGEAALAQALAGDVRLAQALAARKNTGIVQEYELSRTGSTVSKAGELNLLGLKFYKEVIEKDVSVTVETPGGATALLFNSLHEEGGMFFSNHAYTRVGLAGRTFPRDGSEGTSQANLFLQVEEGDKFTDHDKFLDRFDTILVAIVGREFFAGIEEKGNAIAQLVADECGSQSPTQTSCRNRMIADPRVIALREEATDLAAAAGSNAQEQELLVTLVDRKMAIHSVMESQALITGPALSILADYRLDDAALSQLSKLPREKFEQALTEYAAAHLAKRPDGSLESKLNNVDNSDLRELGDTFENYMGRYSQLAAAEKAKLGNIGQAGTRFMEVRYELDGNGKPKYDSAIAQSMAQGRSRLMTKMVDKLIDKAGKFPGQSEQAIALALLSVTPSASRDLRVVLNVDDDESQSYKNAGLETFDVYAKGDKVKPIDAGVFSIDALLNKQ